MGETKFKTTDPFLLIGNGDKGEILLTFLIKITDVRNDMDFYEWQGTFSRDIITTKQAQSHSTNSVGPIFDILIERVVRFDFFKGFSDLKGLMKGEKT